MAESIESVMTRDPVCLEADTALVKAAKAMDEQGIGDVLVTQEGELCGIVTDRDITLRAVAEGKGPETPVKDAMSRDPKSCRPDDDVDAVEKVMTESQVRRVPVVDASGVCVGIIAQADLALDERAASNRDVGRVVEQISTPARQVGSAPARF
jgi:CBS domain-containing protein